MSDPSFIKIQHLESRVLELETEIIDARLDAAEAKSALTAASAIDGDERFNEGVEAAAKLLEDRYPLLKYRAAEIRKLKKVTP